MRLMRGVCVCVPARGVGKQRTVERERRPLQSRRLRPFHSPTVTVFDEVCSHFPLCSAAHSTWLGPTVCGHTNADLFIHEWQGWRASEERVQRVELLDRVDGDGPALFVWLGHVRTGKFTFHLTNVVLRSFGSSLTTEWMDSWGRAT